MALKSYVITQTYKAPVVRVTGLPHKPQQITFKTFRKGEIIKGEMKHANNKPAFVLVDGIMVVPLEVLREVVTKQINVGDNPIEQGEKEKKSNFIGGKGYRIEYTDGIVIGALLGVGAVFLAEKQGWIAQPDKKNKLWGGLIGAGMGMYLVYRSKMSRTKI